MHLVRNLEREREPVGSVCILFEIEREREREREPVWSVCILFEIERERAGRVSVHLVRNLERESG